MNRLSASILGALLLLGGVGNVLAEEDGGPFAAGNFSATTTFTTDYVFRGQSLSDEGPAIQGSLDWGYSGFYAGIWGTNIEIGDGSVELDYYGGYAGTVGPIDYDAMLIYYHFAATSDDSVGGVDPDQFETWLTLSHTFAGAPFEPTLGVFWAWSPDFTLEDGTSHYINGTLALSLPQGFGVDFGYGYQDVEGDKTTPSGWLGGTSTQSGFDYTHWQVGLSKEVVGFGLDLRYHDTDENSDFVAYWGTDDQIDERIVFTISRSF